MNPKALYWLDMETTGLDPAEEHILEIAIARAPFERPFQVTMVYNQTIRFTDWSAVDPYVIEMHHKSGLMIDCMRSKMAIYDAESLSLDVARQLEKVVATFKNDWVSESGEKMKSDELPVLAGSSVHFDRGFLKHHLEDFSKLFSHRYYDVSALKLFCRSMGMAIQPKAEAHRAMEDIMESITHARQCAAWLHLAAEVDEGMFSGTKPDVPF
jgi:oligoribonuclease